jgi:hypothetical protein
MSDVSIDTLNAYIKSYEDDDDGLKQIYLDSAEAMVKDYIGYDYNELTYEDLIQQTGEMVQLSAFPVTELTSVVIDGVTIPNTEFKVVKEKLYYLTGDFNYKSTTVVRYTAGNAEIPGIIKLVVLQIAALLFSESNGNIGITSKATLDNNMRTFVKTTNFTPYLSKLDSLRITRL